jgi:hypothetical protein
MFVNATSGIREDIDTISTEGNFRDFVGRKKRWRIELNRMPHAKEVRDLITTESPELFQSSSHINAAKILDCSNFLNIQKVSREHTRFCC